MRKILVSALAGVLTVFVGSGVALAQDEGSKVIPVEIFTCSFRDGKGMSDIDAAVEGWNGYMDDNDVDSYAAWTLTKAYYGPEQDFDMIWLGAWTDGNAMGTGTDMTNATGGAYIEPFLAALECDNHINVASINYKLPDAGGINDGVIAISNCNFEHGKRYSDVSAATGKWADALTEAGSASAIYHWFPIYGGGGEDSPDFVWATSYPDYAALGADYERMGNGQMFMQSSALFADLLDCDVTRVYDAKSRRTAKLR